MMPLLFLIFNFVPDLALKAISYFDVYINQNSGEQL